MAVDCDVVNCGVSTGRGHPGETVGALVDPWAIDAEK
jgi:hypothetical protein